MLDCGGFVAGRDYGDYMRPRARQFVPLRVVIEFAEMPEFAASDSEVQPDGDGNRRNYKGGGRHRVFWRSTLRRYNGNGFGGVID